MLANHTYATNGAFTITTKVTDDGGSTLTATGTAAISGLVEGQAGSLVLLVPVGNLQVQSGTAYTAAMTWGW